MSESAEPERKLQSYPRWSWSGVDTLNFSQKTKDLERLLATLPGKQSADDQILAFLVDLRARFQRWLHQDEFGPTRRQQTAALRALKRSLQTLLRQLAKGAPPHREQLDVMLRSGDRSVPMLERIYEAAGDLERYLRTLDSLNREVDWASKIQACAETTMAQSQSLDTNADSEILLIAIRHHFDPLQTYPPDFGLADAEQWLNVYWNVVDEALCELNKRHGGDEPSTVLSRHKESGKARGRVEARPAQPVNRAVATHQSRSPAIANQCIIFDAERHRTLTA